MTRAAGVTSGLDTVWFRVTLSIMKSAKHSITGARVTHYADNGQTIAHISWSDGSHTSGDPGGIHVLALLARATRDGVTVVRDQWGA